MNEPTGIQRLTVGPVATNCYLLRGPEGVVIVDPGEEAERIRAACEDRIAGILLTHGHFDHIGAVRALMAEDTALYIHPLDEELLGDPEKNASWMIGTPVTAPSPTGYAEDGQTIRCGGLDFRVWHTPGHTKGSVCYECGGLLLTGDTIFNGGYGRTDLYGGSDNQMMASLKRMQPLRRTHTILPGHGG